MRLWTGVINMVGLSKMEGRKYGKCISCYKQATTSCDKTRRPICPSCVYIIPRPNGQVEIRHIKTVIRGEK